LYKNSMEGYRTPKNVVFDDFIELR
jgi:hypothetical protein